MKDAPEPVPTDTDILESKVDEMSTVSSRLETEIAEEREKRHALEERLSNLEQSHSALAAKYTTLATLLVSQTKGKEDPKTRGLSSAHTLLSSSSNMGSKASSSLPPAPSSEKASQPRGGMAGGRRRGGIQ